ncbi:glycosyltransferase [Gillisia sp. M10.2A]|uniref:Glycosyltransferase n=1 Tax=Gillisia lutea TaxID=2909668 RepID=A0ABS9EGW4_9FLAO|nr:glycosyltransferase [Gillisia lutea]MCF4102132.1 glycosyltransferase [Gillisia lutea]
MIFKEFITSQGEILIYTGSPDLPLVDSLSRGPGDLWHSSLDQGYARVFPELVYQTAVFWWFLNDFENLDTSINWRINPSSFVVRKSVWNVFNGFSSDYESEDIAAFEMGYRMLRHGGAIPLYVKELYPPQKSKIEFSIRDRYRFYKKNFKTQHSVYMFLKLLKVNALKEFKTYWGVDKEILVKNTFPSIPARTLSGIKGNPTVSVVIPTMYRQNYTLQLLKDYNSQTYPVTQIIVVDATPEDKRDDTIYSRQDFNFKLTVRWQKSTGSCHARNEAIQLCRGDYIIFADDDTRILPDFVENHLKFLQKYNVEACNGLDISAPIHTDGLDKLKELYKRSKKNTLIAGAAMSFSNANSCVKRELVESIIGNDINFDGGYGEDTDFGFRLLKTGAILMQNPYSPILHLKPPSGGYRHWGLQASLIGKARKKQAWELDHPVKYIKPVPSPTILYGILKHYPENQVREYRSKYFFLYLFKGKKGNIFLRLLKLPYKRLQFNRSLFYAKNLLKLGERF